MLPRAQAWHRAADRQRRPCTLWRETTPQNFLTADGTFGDPRLTDSTRYGAAVAETLRAKLVAVNATGHRDASCCAPTDDFLRTGQAKSDSKWWLTYQPQRYNEVANPVLRRARIRVVEVHRAVRDAARTCTRPTRLMCVTLYTDLLQILSPPQLQPLWHEHLGCHVGPTCTNRRDRVAGSAACLDCTQYMRNSSAYRTLLSRVETAVAQKCAVV